MARESSSERGAEFSASTISALLFSTPLIQRASLIVSTLYWRSGFRSGLRGGIERDLNAVFAGAGG